MDEYEIIDLLTRVAGKLPARYTPIGDDVAALDPSPGKVVLKADMLVARTDVPPGMTWRQVGRKSVAACVSDFASKGVRPEAFMVSLGIPRRMGERAVRSLVTGFGDAAREWGIRLIGGDTNEADDVVVDCILTGFADKFVGRGGARPGDLVVATGDFGTTSAGLKILLERARCAPAFRRVATRNVYLPSPRLRLGIALQNYFSSAMDSSDGLAICMHALSAASGVGMRIDVLPHAEELEEFAARNRYGLRELILFGGEEYEIVGTMPKDRVGRAGRIASSMNTKLTVIGETTAGGRVESADGSPIENRGWIQLR